MITGIAVGYCREKPVLKLFESGRQKCEFEVVDKSFRRVGQEWEPVYESATFVAWDELAQRAAEKLEPGTMLEAIGRQETSRWTDDSGTKRSRLLYRLYDFRVFPMRSREQGEGAERERRTDVPQNAERPVRQQAPSPRAATAATAPRQPVAPKIDPAQAEQPTKRPPPGDFKLDY